MHHGFCKGEGAFRSENGTRRRVIVFVFAIGSIGGAVLRLNHEPSETAFISIFALQLMLGGLAVIGYLLGSMVTAQKRMAAALREDIHRREQAENEIRRLNAELEDTVRQWTRQLLEAREELVRKEKLASSASSRAASAMSCAIRWGE